MEKIVEQGLLYDFYGELLSPHQRKVYEDVVYNDMSLSEIAEEVGISRQGVHDLIRRCDRMLLEYEEKLHLLSKFTKAREQLAQIEKLSEADSGEKTEVMGNLQEIGKIARELSEEL